MAAKLLALVTVLFIGVCCAQTDPRIELDDLIDGIFNKPPEDTRNVIINPVPGGNQPPVNPPFNPTPVQQPVNPPLTNPQPTSNSCGFGSECVAYYLCKNNTIIKDGAGIIDIRIDEGHPEPCPLLEVCCDTEDKVKEPLQQLPTTPTGCGYRNTDGIGFTITGGSDNESEYGEFPWMVAIMKIENGLNQVLNIYQCGGSLIHPSVVLTAAHCVQNKQPGELNARAGEWDTKTKSEPLPDQVRSIADIVVHEQYYKGGLYNDVALLFLTEPFILEENVKTVCLPPPNTVFDYSRCLATGWGKDQFGDQGRYHTILKKVDMPIVPYNQCQTLLRTTRLGKRFELHDSFICAGGEPGKDTCKGDGGSPLVCPIEGTNNRYYQAGIVAWGIGCNTNIPGVYANVPKLRSWIDTQLAYKRIESAHFTP